MQRALQRSGLVPRGFDVESAVCDGATAVITVRASGDKRSCVLVRSGFWTCP